MPPSAAEAATGRLIIFPLRGRRMAGVRCSAVTSSILPGKHADRMPAGGHGRLRRSGSALSLRQTVARMTCFLWQDQHFARGGGVLSATASAPPAGVPDPAGGSEQAQACGPVLASFMVAWM